MTKEITLVCKIRADLISQNLGIPVGTGHIPKEDEKNKFKFRWVNDEIFEIFYKGKWQEAESIDFDFCV